MIFPESGDNGGSKGSGGVHARAGVVDLQITKFFV